MSLTIKVEKTDFGIVFRRLEEAVKSLVERAADYGEEEMKRRAPVRKGRLRGSIRKRVDLVNLEAEVGPGVPYAVFVEFGTRPHIIRPVRAQALRFEVGGEIVFAKLVRHPGTRPQPFMRETAEAVERRIPGLWREAWR